MSETMEMQRESPLKAWVRRHSPLKSRNKPLPAPPTESTSPSRKPIEPVSGNLPGPPPPPPKTKDKNSTAAPQQPRRKISGLLHRHKSYDDTSVSYKQSRPRSRSPSSPRNDGFRVTKPKHKSSGKSSPKAAPHPPHIYHLTEKVSTLEAQLLEARREIQQLHSRRAPSPFEYNRLIEARHVSLVGARKYDGLVENLLDAGAKGGGQQTLGRPYDSKPAGRPRCSSADFASEARTKPSIRATSGGGGSDSWAREAAALRSDESPNTVKRKRSELREAEWARIQQHLASQPPEEAEEQDRPRQKRKQHHDREASQHRAARGQREQHSSSSSSSGPHKGRSDRISAKPYCRTAKASENVEIFRDEEEEEKDGGGEAGGMEAARPPSAHRRHVTSPSRLDKIQEEFEWDEEVF